VVCGATREFNSGYDTRVTPAGVKEILDEQLALCPGLAHGTIAEVRVGLRPYSEDGVPFIGTVPGTDNVIVSTGHGPSGLQLGPYSGLLAAELAQGLQPSTNLESFRLNRSIESGKVAS
jgi:D-amino-acid dehydrogenase